METLIQEKIISPQQCTASLRAVDDAIYVIGGKWRLKIIISLKEGSKRFNELQKSIKGISAKVLSNELKHLEQNGLVIRSIDQDKSSVEYQLTEYHHSLHEVLNSLTSWGLMHRSRIMNVMNQ